MKIAIIADSGCQIKINELHPGIYIVPLSITMEEKAYLDQIEVETEDVFNQMKEKGVFVKTSQPPLGAIVDAFNQAKNDGYEEVIAISIATGLSSTLSSMKMAAEMADIPVTLIDSKSTALIHRELVYSAKELIDEGKTSTEIKTILDKMVENSRTLILVPNLDHLKKGGRITPAVAMLAGLLKIVPVMELNHDLGGKIDSYAKVRTLKKAMKTIVDRLVELNVNNKEYVFAIEHVLCEMDAQKVKELLIEAIGECQVTIRELPVVVGAHMGIGGIGVQYVKKHKFI